MQRRLRGGVSRGSWYTDQRLAMAPPAEPPVKTGTVIVGIDPLWGNESEKGANPTPGHRLVAQFGRVPVSKTGGCRFKSYLACLGAQPLTHWN